MVKNLSALTQDKPDESYLANAPPWFEPGITTEVPPGIYRYFLGTLPRRLPRENRFLAGTDGTGPLRLFWKTGERYFARELTTKEVSELGRAPRSPLQR